MWFIVLILTPVNDPAVTDTMAQATFATHRQCMAAAGGRTAILANVGLHGRYLCAYHREPDRELAATVKREF